MRTSSLFCLLGLIAIFLTACAAGTDLPARTVETYLQALADKDLNRMIAAGCGEFETQARFELDTFAGVETRAESLACTVSNQAGETAQVTCSGAIVAAYGAEDRSFPLDGRLFNVQRQGRAWLVCGAE